MDRGASATCGGKVLYVLKVRRLEKKYSLDQYISVEKHLRGNKTVCAITGRRNVKSGKKIGEIVKNFGKFLYLYGGNLRNQT